MSERIKEGIVSNKDGEKTFDQVYANGIDLDEQDEMFAKQFSHCFESARGKNESPRLTEATNSSNIAPKDLLSKDDGALWDEEHEDDATFIAYATDQFNDDFPGSVGDILSAMGEAFGSANTVEDGLNMAIDKIRENGKLFISQMYGENDQLIIQKLSNEELKGELVQMLQVVAKEISATTLSSEVTIPSNQRVKNDFDESTAQRRKDGLKESKGENIVDELLVRADQYRSEHEGGQALNESADLPGNMLADYTKRAQAERDAGATIEIKYDYVAITMSDGTEYFFQGEEADELLSDIPDNINREDFILAIAQDW